MAWTIAIVLANLGLSVLLLSLNNAFDKQKQSIKVFLISLTFGSLIILSQTIKLIVNDKATGDTLTKLNSLANTTLTITISIFSFFMLLFFILYTKDIIYSLKEAKNRKKTSEWGEI